VIDLYDPEDDDLDDPLDFAEEVSELENTYKDRQLINLRLVRRDFKREFPFDVVNLDLERYPFRSREPVPGRLISALREMLRWQQRPLIDSKGREEYLTGFTLMLTTRVGPTTMGDDHLGMLRDNLEDNIRNAPELAEVLRERTGITEINNLQNDNFETFFKIATPKVLARELYDADWYVDPASGVEVYEFERDTEGGDPYRMLHLVMHVVRQDPPRKRRGAGVLATKEATTAYRQVVSRIFSEPEERVSLETINAEALRKDLQRIAARRILYRQSE
jgi:hypothetical protein